MSPSETRIIKALSVRPMTVNELVGVTYVDPSWLRHVLRRMKAAGLICIGQKAPRSHSMGATPRYWELSA